MAQILNNYAASITAGTVGGLVLGYMAMKVTRKAGAAAGLGIIGYEVAHHNRLVSTSLDSVMAKVRSRIGDTCSKYCSKTKGQMKSLGGKNKALTVGLIGGSLLGIACS